MTGKLANRVRTKIVGVPPETLALIHILKVASRWSKLDTLDDIFIAFDPRNN